MSNRFILPPYLLRPKHKQYSENCGFATYCLRYGLRQTPTNYVLRSFLVLLPLRVRSTSQSLKSYGFASKHASATGFPCISKFISPTEVINSNLDRDIFVRDCVSPENCGFTTSSGLRNSLTSRRMCEKSIYWVLSYRNAPQKKHLELCRNGFVEGHTHESWKWTLRESEIIRQKGFEYWFYRTKGPYGFQSAKSDV